MRIFEDSVMGVVVNKSQEHWYAFKMLEQQIWHLDSQETPRDVTFQEFLEYVRKDRNAFLVRHI